MSGDAAAAKKPPTAYFLWLNKTREAIQKEVGAKDFKSVAGRASELWKAMSEQDKKPFEEEAAKLKEAYNKFKETDEGKAALAAKKEEKQEKNSDHEKKAIKTALKSIEKDDNLKRPTSAYWMWLNENRETITATLGSKKGSDVAKKGGEMWQALSSVDKEPWEKKAKAAKDAYEAYLKSPEGVAALKAYKDAAKAATSEVSAKAADGPTSPDAKEPETKKRGREPKKADSPTSGKEERAAKKPRGAKEVPKDLSEEIVAACKAATKAGEPSMEGMLRKLFETEKLTDKGLTPEQGLEALKSSGGLLNKARGMLLAQLGA